MRRSPTTAASSRRLSHEKSQPTSGGLGLRDERLFKGTRHQSVMRGFPATMRGARGAAVASSAHTMSR
jgi:hypothetical protein